MKESIFWIFGILQSTSLGAIIFLLFNALNRINGENVIGMDTLLVLSITFPLFLLIVEYMIFKRQE